MIKEFESYESASEMTMDYIVGIPSGEVIDINYKDVNNLKQEGLITWNSKYQCYAFFDMYFNNVIGFLNRHGHNRGKNLTPNTTVLDQDFMDKIVEFLDNQKNINNYVILQDGVDVAGDIYVSDGRFTKFPFKFKRVSGDFIWKNCKLETLHGAPEEVGRSFIVSHNNLMSLDYGPTYVGNIYDCCDNFLISLKGSPEIIRGDFDCSSNFLTFLKDGPKKVKGFFDCTDNKLKTMEGMPECNHIKSDIGIPGETSLKSYKKFRDEGDGKFRW